MDQGLGARARPAQPLRPGERLPDWHDWIGGPAHGVHTRLDQVGTRAHLDNHEDGSVRFAPTLYVNASRCGELLPTVHEDYWDTLPEEVGLSTTSARVTDEKVAGLSQGRAAAYREMPADRPGEDE